MATKFEKITLWTAVETFVDERALSALDWIVWNMEKGEPEVHLINYETEEYTLVPKEKALILDGGICQK
jgi:hypothetical protein